MSPPPFEVADIIRTHGDRFIDEHDAWLTAQHRRVLRAIARCRTAALGGHVDRCTRCDHRVISYNSCRNRHCPKCLTGARDRWLAAREQELLPVGYHHVVFTLPHELSWLALQNKAVIYDLLFQASAATLLEIAADPKHLGASIGFLAVLHTWGQTLLHHPHVHCVIPVGGLSADHTRWIGGCDHFFLPVKVLSRVFRGKFVAGLRALVRRGALILSSRRADLTNASVFRAWLRRLYRHDWIVYAKPPFGGPTHVLHYLARYTHRVAVSNHRIVAITDDQITFRWKDYAHGSQSRLMTISAIEFLRRFCLHVLPKGFVRIRFFGFLAHRRRTRDLASCRRALAVATPPTTSSPTPPSTAANWPCPRCGAAMILNQRITALQMLVYVGAVSCDTS